MGRRSSDFVFMVQNAFSPAGIMNYIQNKSRTRSLRLYGVESSLRDIVPMANDAALYITRKSSIERVCSGIIFVRIKINDKFGLNFNLLLILPQNQITTGQTMFYRYTFNPINITTFFK